MPKSKFPKSVKFVDIEDLKQYRFSFIKNDILKENIAMNMQFIIFLVTLDEEYELPGSLRYLTFKTIILYTASIIESLINYKLSELISDGKINSSKTMDMVEKYHDSKELYKISNTESVIGVIKSIKPSKLESNTDFIKLNRASKRCGLFDEKLFNKAEKLRDMRNKIHLSALNCVDDKYSKDEINEVFKIAKDLIERIEKY